MRFQSYGKLELVRCTGGYHTFAHISEIIRAYKPAGQWWHTSVAVRAIIK